MGLCKYKHLLFLCIVQLIQIVLSVVVNENRCANASTVGEEYESRIKVLSRRKRFLTFPDGSSLQLVFCCQTAALIPIGDIFLYGNTAALAWNLPSDPDLFHYVKKFERTQRRGDSKTVNYVDDRGRIIASVPYSRKQIVNPAFAKRSIDEPKMSFKDKLKIKIDRLKMHERQVERDYLKTHYASAKSIEFHRNSRVGLYEKIEKLLTALGREGRPCVLRKLCESARGSARQGTFLQELMRVVFTLPKGNEFHNEDHKAYDKAHSENEDCSTLYPECDLAMSAEE